MVQRIYIQSNSYYDSVVLMKISKEITELDGIVNGVIVMGTELNKELLDNVGFREDSIKNAGGNDLIIALEGEEKTIEKAFEMIQRKLKERKDTQSASDYFPKTLDSALKVFQDANIAIISVPGEYAHIEANKALDAGLNVMIFSDNVPIDKELELKKKGLENGLLVMGPDCGTAIISGAPLAFANVVRRGNIGIVGASGTGIQEVTTIIHNLGGGISQAIGTGGRDLSDEIGGITFKMGLMALIDDPSTDVIILISKPPSDKIASEIIQLTKETDKPVVIHFIGKEGKELAGSLEEAAIKALELIGIKQTKGLTTDYNLVKKEIEKKTKYQKYLRGLFTGGTLASECINLLEKNLNTVIYSNISKKAYFKYGQKQECHYVLDLGDDEYTVGRPHPMIDPAVREKILEEIGDDPGASVVIMDFVLGFGSHEDPVGAMEKSIKKAKEKASAKGRHLTFVASICGTDEDPQNLQEQKKKLKELGVITMDTNRQAALMAAKILRGDQ